ncbi:MAG: 3-keto-L-gulonate transporter [Desulfovibrio sp.]|nr:MAG: 3-keto-L-gulonate transporter [Desulfovibrio sp.]
MASESSRWKSLMLCFARTYMVAGAFNTRGMQNVGLAFIMNPGLKAMYRDSGQLSDARKRYLKHYNTHFFWTPLLVGVFLSVEDKIAKGLFSPTVLDNVKNTTAYTLSAIGDSVFGGSLLVFWSLSTACFIVSDLIGAAMVWAVLWFIALQVFKLTTFIIGFREGLKFLVRLRQWDLINWGRRLKLVNALLLVLLFSMIWPEHFSGVGLIPTAGVLALVSWAVSRALVARELVAILVLTVYLAWPLISQLCLAVF